MSGSALSESAAILERAPPVRDPDTAFRTEAVRIEEVERARREAGDKAAKPLHIPMIATSISMPRHLFEALDEARRFSNESRSGIIARLCIEGVRKELRVKCVDSEEEEEEETQ